MLSASAPIHKQATLMFRSVIALTFTTHSPFSTPQRDREIARHSRS
jgi:hypothetical protein